MSNEKVDSKFEFEIYDLARVMNASSHLLLLVTSRIFPRVFHSVFCTHPPYIKHKQRFHLHNNWVPGVSFPSHCFEIQNSSSSSSDFWLSQTSLIYSHYLATKEIGSKIKKGTGIGFVNERGKILIIRAQRIGFIPDHVKPSFFASSLMPLRTFTFRISPKSTNNDSIILFLICGKIPLKLFTKRKSPFQCSDVYLVIQPGFERSSGRSRNSTTEILRHGPRHEQFQFRNPTWITSKSQTWNFFGHSGNIRTK